MATYEFIATAFPVESVSANVAVEVNRTGATSFPNTQYYFSTDLVNLIPFSFETNKENKLKASGFVSGG
jgi:hypothetical protein